jgi:hypothetical protein
VTRDRARRAERDVAKPANKTMEPPWSPVVASGGNRLQIVRARKRGVRGGLPMFRDLPDARCGSN